MVKKTIRESENSVQEETIEASGEAILIRDGLFAIADSIDRFAEMFMKINLNQETFDEPQQQEFYMDGTPIKK